jgi:hypothetical protein
MFIYWVKARCEDTRHPPIQKVFSYKNIFIFVSRNYDKRESVTEATSSKSQEFIYCLPQRESSERRVA